MVDPKIYAENAQARAATDAPSKPQHHSTQAPNTASHNQPLDINIKKPFHRLHAKTWLHGRSERDVYKLLIDTYRLRVVEDNNLTGNVDVDSPYGGATADGGTSGFRRFLRMAQRIPGLLPEWWCPAKTTECIQMGCRTRGWNVEATITIRAIMMYYGDNSMPMQLRMLGEQIYGTGPGGQNGAGVMQLQLQIESRGFETGYLDSSPLFHPQNDV